MLVKSKKSLDINSPRTLAHFLSSALRLEEQLSNSVYRDYLDPEDWPEERKWASVFGLLLSELFLLLTNIIQISIFVLVLVL